MTPAAFAALTKLHVVGIKGSGTVAVADILHARGVRITGSDGPEKFFTDEVLARLGIPYHESFAASHVPADADAVLYSTAYKPETNVELAEAVQRTIPLVSYPEALALLFNAAAVGIAACGSHGKTTTSAMLAHVLAEAHCDPTAVIGGRVSAWGTNARVGAGPHFVIEADEYQNKLSHYAPRAVILTSVDWDHPDFYPTPAAYEAAFTAFVEKIPADGVLVAFGDDAAVRRVAARARCPVHTYGFGERNDIRITAYTPAADAVEADVCLNDATVRMRTTLPGRHAVLNAAAVLALASWLGVPTEQALLGIASFTGTSRRFERIGEHNGALLVDDYGHHPAEVAATLAGARERYPERRIIAVFQPHSFSRTAAFLAEFAQALTKADEVLVLDIYGSAREQSGSVHARDLVALVNKHAPEKATHTPAVADAVALLVPRINARDVVLCIGAGNGVDVARRLAQA